MDFGKVIAEVLTGIVTLVVVFLFSKLLGKATHALMKRKGILKDEPEVIETPA